MWFSTRPSGSLSLNIRGSGPLLCVHTGTYLLPLPAGFHRVLDKSSTIPCWPVARAEGRARKAANGEENNLYIDLVLSRTPRLDPTTERNTRQISQSQKHLSLVD